MVTGTKHVVIVQGHPDPQHRHFCHALVDAYDAGAREAGHEVLTTTSSVVTGCPYVAMERASLFASTLRPTLGG